MAKIQMDYVLVEKNKHEEKTIRELLMDFVSENFEVFDANYIKINEDDVESLVQYSLEQKKNSVRCYAHFVSNRRVNLATKDLEIIHIALKSSPLQRYFHVVKVYDGVSASYCERLYPKYAEYERKLRYMILLIVMKAYGSNWIETVPREMETRILDKAHVGSLSQISFDKILEYTDLAELENYLFKPNETDFEQFVKDELNPEKVKDLEKEEIMQMVENVLFPTCLWERVFSDIGDMKNWKEAIDNVHDIRNGVAHHKTITREQYEDTVKQLKHIIKMIDLAIKQVKKEDFENTKSIDILGNFVFFAGKNLFNALQEDLITNVVSNLNKRLQELVKPIQSQYPTETIKSIQENAMRFSKINLGLQSDMKEQMKIFSKNMAMISSSGLGDMGKAIKKMQIPQLRAIEMTQRVQNLLSQLSMYGVVRKDD